eukprot:TRINITY_DN2164_c0_g1_i1.p1 TRINITY_DN2164_c0_g1~~TRINITY_DN2164_c0_g1_i1.p1  ORF type:complete len:202 (-),score=33.24 TRINITY_DN2164_c0_g1_i1:132-737(-)
MFTDQNPKRFRLTHLSNTMPSKTWKFNLVDGPHVVTVNFPVFSMTYDQFFVDGIKIVPTLVNRYLYLFPVGGRIFQFNSQGHRLFANSWDIENGKSLVDYESERAKKKQYDVLKILVIILIGFLNIMFFGWFGFLITSLMLLLTFIILFYYASKPTTVEISNDVEGLFNTFPSGYDEEKAVLEKSTPGAPPAYSQTPLPPK